MFMQVPVNEKKQIFVQKRPSTKELDHNTAVIFPVGN